MTSPEPTVVISKRLVAVNALSLAMSRLLSVGLLIWVNQHLLRRLSAAEYAPYPMVVALVLFLQVFTAGLTSGIARYVTEAYAEGNRERVTEIVSSMMPMILGGASVFLSLGALLCWQIQWVLNVDPAQEGDARLMMVILVGSHCLVLLLMPFSVGLHVRQKFAWLAVIRLLGLLLQIAVLAALLLGVSTRVLWVVISSEAATIAIALVSFVLSRRLIPELRFRRAAIRRATTRTLSSFGWWTMLGNLMYRVRTSADVLILSNFGTDNDLNVTAFHLGTLHDRQLNGLLGPATAAIDPALTAMHAIGDDAALNRAFLRGNRLFLWMVLAVAVPLVVFARELVLLYVQKEALLLAVPVIVVMCIRYPFTYSCEMLYRVALAKARIRAIHSLLSLMSLLKIVLAITLVAYYDMGIWGVLVASLVTTAIAIFGFMWPISLRMTNLTMREFTAETLVPGWTPAAVATLVTWGMGQLVPAVSWTTVFFDIGVGLVAYLLVMIAVAMPEDREDMAGILHKVRRMFGGGR